MRPKSSAYTKSKELKVNARERETSMLPDTLTELLKDERQGAQAIARDPDLTLPPGSPSLGQRISVRSGARNLR